MRDVSRLHPELQVKCQKFIELCAAEGIDIVITQTLRTAQEQNDLYKIGRRGVPGETVVTNLKYPRSPHCWGMAFDIAIREGKRVYYPEAKLQRAGAIGEAIGLTWGGKFKSFVDKPHFELKWFKLIKLMDEFGTPDRFIASWSQEDGEVEKVKVVMNGKEYDAFLKDGKTYVPVRAIAEGLGAKVTWDSKNRIATVTK